LFVWKKSKQQKKRHFQFCEQKNARKDFSDGVFNYTNFVKMTSIENRLFSTLVAIFEENDLSNLEDEHSFCWEKLQMLHEDDPSDWPESVPIDANDHKWSFCFNGVQLFINMSCPSHSTMKSRRLGRRVAFVINPRENFDFVASSAKEKGIAIREVIRGRVKAYNGGFFSGALGFFGDPQSPEWKQYQLLEPEQSPVEKCPFLTNPAKQNTK